MLRNYLRVEFRGLWRRKGYSAINLVGLAVALACVTLISFYVRDELSFDDHNEHADRIVRVLVGDR